MGYPELDGKLFKGYHEKYQPKNQQKVIPFQMDKYQLKGEEIPKTFDSIFSGGLCHTGFLCFFKLRKMNSVCYDLEQF
jgi:hypothetical protein